MIHRLLLVDDDASLVAVLVSALTEEGFSVRTARNGWEGLQLFKTDPCDLVLLDILMPEMDGLEVCRRLRAESDVPIILLTSRGEEVDRITGLETGADDYITKPFSIRELAARIRAISRRVKRGAAPPEEKLEAEELVVGLARFRVELRGHPVELTRSELLVLAALVRQRGFVLPRDRLLELARGDGVVVTDRTADTFIKRIRKKLRDVSPTFDDIETVIGVGYRYRSATR